MMLKFPQFQENYPVFFFSFWYFIIFLKSTYLIILIALCSINDTLALSFRNIIFVLSLILFYDEVYTF
jgi:hypothetical protein